MAYLGGQTAGGLSTVSKHIFIFLWPYCIKHFFHRRSAPGTGESLLVCNYFNFFPRLNLGGAREMSRTIKRRKEYP